MSAEIPHPLKTFLQLQLASDTSAVLHLPYLLTSLTSECFSPSPHLQLWTARINSLIHSRDPGSRWAGLCIAYKTSVLSKDIMTECAQGWLAIALPILSKKESTPTLKLAVRLLGHIFTTSTQLPEFQRQVVAPNVPKVSQALIELAENHTDNELKILALATLTRIVPMYATLHRSLHASLSVLSSKYLCGSAPTPTNIVILEAASRLFAVLHFTGGKVGAANLWRKSMDETLAYAWATFRMLRSTFPDEEHHSVPSHLSPPVGDPLVQVPLGFDRLRCCVVMLCDLLKSTAHRSVQVPVGPLVKFSTALLNSTTEGQLDGYVEHTVRAMEISVVPLIWKLSCDLLVCLAKCAKYHLTPHVPRTVTYITIHLERKLPPPQRLVFLQTLETVLSHSYPIHAPLLLGRLAKAILSSLSIVLVTPSETSKPEDIGASKKGKGKKRARKYGGDEVFKISREVICKTSEEGSVLLTALGITQLLLRNSNLPPAMVSLSSRILLSIIFSLPQVSPASLSPDLSLHSKVLELAHTVSAVIASGTTSMMNKSLGLMIVASIADGKDRPPLLGSGFEILLHPRVPPLLRSLPQVKALSLHQMEESREEADAREALGLEVIHSPPSVPTEISSTTAIANESTNISPPPLQIVPLIAGLPLVKPLTISAVADNQNMDILPVVADVGTVVESAPLPASKTAPLLDFVATGPGIQSMAPTFEPPRAHLNFGEDEDEEMVAINMDSDSD